MPITGADDTGCLAVFPLRTSRLLLRPISFDDSAAVTALAGDAAVAETTTHIPHPYDESMAKAWIARERNRMAIGEAVTLAIEEKSAAGLIGAISLGLDGTRRQGEVGFWVGRPYWSRGYGAEALWALMEHAFERMGVERVRAAAMAENAASIRVQEKTGFEPAGRREETETARGRAIELDVRELDRAAWHAICVKRRQILLVAAIALVDKDGRVLLARRPADKPMAGLWEFPGGKVHPGETPESALVREMREELGIDITGSCLAPFTFASHAYADFHLLMPLYVCRQWKGEVMPLEGQILNWVRPARMHRLPMPPADEPLVAMLRDLL